MILIVNLNLAVDRIIEVDDFCAGGVQRSRGAARAAAGGKGVNVARVLKTLGERALLLGFTGGGAGARIEAGLRAEGIDARPTRIAGESRTCLIINDRLRGEQTVINEPGAEVSHAEFRDFETGYAEALAHAALVVITGSLPPNLPESTYARLIEAARDAGSKPVLLDCAGASLGRALEARPFIVKINASEASALLNAPVADFAGAARAARSLRERGAAHGAMITLGEQGAVFDFAETTYRLVAPAVRATNSVGSGDAALAGLAAGLKRGLTAEAAGALAVAAGAANALHGAGACSAEEIRELLPRVRSEVENVEAG